MVLGIDDAYVRYISVIYIRYICVIHSFHRWSPHCKHMLEQKWCNRPCALPSLCTALKPGTSWFQCTTSAVSREMIYFALTQAQSKTFLVWGSEVGVDLGWKSAWIHSRPLAICHGCSPLLVAAWISQPCVEMMWKVTATLLPLRGSGPILSNFQCCCSCASGICAASCGGRAVTGAFLRYGNMCSLTTGLHCGHTRAGKLDGIGSTQYKQKADGCFTVDIFPVTSVRKQCIDHVHHKNTQPFWKARANTKS